MNGRPKFIVNIRRIEYLVKWINDWLKEGCTKFEVKQEFKGPEKFSNIDCK